MVICTRSNVEIQFLFPPVVLYIPLLIAIVFCCRICAMAPRTTRPTWTTTNEMHLGVTSNFRPIVILNNLRGRTMAIMIYSVYTRTQSMCAVRTYTNAYYIIYYVYYK